MSIKVLSILTAISVICFLALAGIQVVELKHYSAAPSAWPQVP